MTQFEKKIIELLLEIKWAIIVIWAILAVIVTIVAFKPNAHATGPWTRDQKWTYGYFSLLNIADMGQTYNIYQSEGFHEAFPLAKLVLKDKPENAKYVPLMFLGSNLTCLGIAHLLPSKWYWTRPRQWFLSSITLFEVYAVGRNACYGVRWRIPFK